MFTFHALASAAANDALVSRKRVVLITTGAPRANDRLMEKLVSMVGAAGVGTAEGVGTGVGSGVGFKVGFGVGFGVGTGVGSGVGFKVGFGVGFGVGTGVGAGGGRDGMVQQSVIGNGRPDGV